MLNNRKLYIFIILLFIAIKIFLIRNQPVLAVVTAIGDDRHFIDQAKFILGGNWLGSYSNYTLTKGPFFPFWIDFAFLVGIPLLQSEHLLYIFACLILIIALQPLLRRREFSLILFSALLFNPFTYDTYTFTRVMRDPLYTCLIILVLACGIAIFLRRKELPAKNIPWALGLGLAFSAASLTREETPWLLPPLLFIFIISMIGSTNLGIRSWISRISIWALIPMIYVLCAGIVSLINYEHYSCFCTTEMSAPEFVAAYSAIERVTPEELVPMVPLPKETRMRIYPVSPAFKELEPYLEGDLGKFWETAAPLPDLPKGEIIGGWFIWAFRDAVAAAGHYKAGKFPASYYQTLANEVNAACASGKIKCTYKPISLAPAWNNAYLKPVVDSFIKGLTSVVSFQGFYPYPVSSVTDSGKGDLLFRDLTQTEISETSSMYKISGWAVNKDSNVYEIITQNDQDFAGEMIIKYVPSPDVYNYFLSQGENVPNANLARFEITTSCTSNCFLEVRRGNETLKKIKLDGLRTPLFWNDIQTTGSIDTIEYFYEGLAYQDKYNALKMRVLEGIGSLYQFASPFLAIVSTFAFLILTVMIRKAFDTWGVMGIMILSIFSRIGLLAVTDATSFPSISSLYLSPAYPLMIAFTTFAILYAIDFLIKKLNRTQPHKKALN